MRITLADGIEISNLILTDDDIFISEKPINKDVFENNLSEVIVGADTHKNRDNCHFSMKLIYFEKKEYHDYKKGWFFKLEREGD